MVTTAEPDELRDKELEILLVKHYVLRQERSYERIHREVEALENLEKLDGVSRGRSRKALDYLFGNATAANV